MNMNGHVKRFLCLVLSVLLLFAVFPVKSEAAQVGKNLRTNAKIGKTYTYKCYYPGIGYVDMNVTFKSAKNVKSTANGYLAKTVVLKITMPEKTRIKIKNNVDKICKAVNGRDFWYSDGFVINYNTGKLATYWNCDTIFETEIVNNKMKKYRKGNYSHNAVISQELRFNCIYNKSMKGKLLLGMAGSTTPIYGSNKKVFNFAAGTSSITTTSFYSKKNKNLSIFYKF